MTIRDEALRSLDRLIEAGRRACSSYSSEGMTIGEQSALEESELWAFRTGAATTIVRLTSEKSEFYRHLPPLPKNGHLAFAKEVVEGTLGVLMSLRAAVQNGELERLEQRVLSNTYDDFLTQAEELLKAKPSYHVAAMVLIGGVLEDQLRKLCLARSLQWKGRDGISAYNDALKEVAYPQAAWRRIQVVGDNRNDAAHGGEDAAKLKQADVEDDLRWVRKFLAEPLV